MTTEPRPDDKDQILCGFIMVGILLLGGLWLLRSLDPIGYENERKAL